MSYQEKPLEPNRIFSLDSLTKIFSAIIPAVVLSFGIYQYTEQKNKESAQKELEFRHLIYEKQFNYYASVTDTIAKLNAIVMRNTSANELFKSSDYIKTKESFINLYYGKINLIESPEVEQAIVNFRQALDNYEAGDESVSDSQLRIKGLEVASACSKSLQKTWGLDSTQFKANFIKR